MQAWSPSRYGIRPADPSTPEARRTPISGRRVAEVRPKFLKSPPNLGRLHKLRSRRTDLLDLRTSATNVSRPHRYSDLAQLVEQAAVNRRVLGSSPRVGATKSLEAAPRGFSA